LIYSLKTSELFIALFDENKNLQVIEYRQCDLFTCSFH